MKKTAIIITISVLAVLALSVFFLWSDYGGDPGLKADAEPGVPEGYSEQDFEDPFREPALIVDGIEVNARDLLEHYREWFKYPPDSRPITKDDDEVVNSVTIDEPYRELVAEKDGEMKKAGYFCRLQPAKAEITEGAVQHVAMSCLSAESHRAGESGGRTGQMVLEGFRIKEAYVEKVLYNRLERLPSILLSYNDEGRDGDRTAGDGEITFQFKPGKKDWGPMQLTVALEINFDDEPVVYTMRNGFYSSPAAPGTFTGNFTESVEDGSLVIEVEMNVKKPGKYRIQGNLRNDRGYISVSKRNVNLKAGRQMVALNYFGKIFHDRDAAGPYYLTELKGYRDNHFITDEMLLSPDSSERLDRLSEKIESGTAALEPLREFVPPNRAEIRTKDYAVDEFSDREYNSPEKEETLEHYKSLAYN